MTIRQEFVHAELSGPATTPAAATPRRWQRVGECVVVVAAVVTGGVVGLRALPSAGTPLWTLARASGLAAYLLLVALVALGLWLAHPASRCLGGHLRGPLLRAHVGLAALTGAFLIVHVTALAIDPHAGLGATGALVPGASEYRTVPVGLGVTALWVGLVVGLTARLAGRVTGRWWLPIHRFAVVVLILVWAHAVLTGTDTAAVRLGYIATGLAVAGLAISRHLATSHRGAAR